MDALNNDHEIQNLLRESEEMLKVLPPELEFGVKHIKGSLDVLEELRSFINKDSDLVSKIQHWRHFDSSGNSGVCVTVIGVATALSGVLVAYLNSKKRKIILQSKGKKLSAENYSVEEVERIMRCFDSIDIE
jgi:hypothetical protein